MKNISIITIERYSTELCDNFPNTLFVFGDSNQGWGMGGQAIIRLKKNAIGIPTKQSPSQYWSDINYESNIASIDKSIKGIIKLMESDDYHILAFPKSGLGTGRAELHIRAPKTFLYLCSVLLEEFNYNNLQALRSENF